MRISSLETGHPPPARFSEMGHVHPPFRASRLPGSYSRLWRRDGRAVRWHDLRLIREHLAALRIHEHLHPMHVVVAVRGVIAKGLDAGEVLDAAAFGVLERLVDSEVVRVAMHVGDRLPEGDHLIA